jgi:putative ABC transport system permease protein
MVATGVSLLTGLLFGLVPAIQASKPNLQEALKAGGGWGAKTGGSRMRSGLVVAQVALSLVLLVVAGLMIRSFNRLMHQSPGLNPEGVLTFNVALPANRYREEGRRRQASIPMWLTGSPR